MDTVWAVVGIVFGALYGAGLVMKDTPHNLVFAKVLFWSSAVLLGGWGFMWELVTEQPIAIRIFVGLIIGIFVFVVVPETIRRLPGVEKSLNENGQSHEKNTIGNISGNGGIVTQSQNGNNNQ